MSDQKSALPSVGILFKDAWQLYISRFWTLIGITLIPVIVTLLFLLLTPLSEAIARFGLYLVSYLGPAVETTLSATLIFYLVLYLLVITVFFILAALALVFAVKASTKVFESYRLASHKFWPYVWLTLLSSLIAIGGFALAIIPGIIFSIWFVFSLYVLVAEDKRGIEALLRSKEYVSGYWWAVFGRIILLAIAIIVVSILVGIVANLFGKAAKEWSDDILQILVTPFSIAYFYLLYRQLVNLKPQLISQAVTTKRGFFIFAAILGLIVSIAVPIILFNLPWAVFLANPVR